MAEEQTLFEQKLRLSHVEQAKTQVVSYADIKREARRVLETALA